MITIQELTSVLSPARLGAYSLGADADSSDAVARYLWNSHLCARFQPALHALEVTLRNALFDASEAHVNTTGRTYGSVQCWLDVHPPLLDNRAVSAVTEAKRLLGNRPHTPGRLIAKMSFGFWTSLFHRPYEHGNKNGPQLWPRLIPTVFPNITRKFANRQAIADKLKSIREFRNRIAHHEPIWDRPILIHHSEILEVLGWMSYPAMKAAQALGDPVVVLQAGQAPYRQTAERILGIRP